jgi:hypothetical protein
MFEMILSEMLSDAFNWGVKYTFILFDYDYIYASDVITERITKEKHTDDWELQK